MLSCICFREDYRQLKLGKILNRGMGRESICLDGLVIKTSTILLVGR